MIGGALQRDTCDRISRELKSTGVTAGQEISISEYAVVEASAIFLLETGADLGAAVVGQAEATFHLFHFAGFTRSTGRRAVSPGTRVRIVGRVVAAAADAQRGEQGEG